MRNILLTILLVLNVLVVQGQNQDPIKMNMIPPSPDVASLGKYGDVPTNNYTGTPNISIPVYEINTGDFSLPVSLSYHASGVKVEDIASSVGLGWSLNAGGVITRAVRGLPDESPNGLFNPATLKVSEILNLPNTSPELKREQAYRSIAQGSLDAEPDIFYYNFGSYSGKFYYNKETQEFVLLPRQPILISFDVNNNNWKVISENGTEYYFENKEINTSSSSCNGSAGPSTSVITGWLLTKIITPIKRQEILLNYTYSSYSTVNISSHTLYTPAFGCSLPACVNPAGQICNSTNNYSGFRLNEITYNEGKIKFLFQTDRCDLVGDKRLDMIEIYNNYEINPFRKFQFDYTYFNSDLFQFYSCGNFNLAYNTRLKLKSITEIGKDELRKPPHEFLYNETIQLPSRLSNGQDHWGYYNGKNNNQNLVPPFINDNGLYLPGADRKVNTYYTQTGILTQIIHPTGGNTTFEYENHSVANYVPYSDSENLQKKSVYLDVTDNCTESNTYCKEFIIDDKRRTGVYVSIVVDGILNCDFCPNGVPNALTCAVLNIQGIDVNDGLSITCNVNNIYLPNGRYLLKADFRGNTSFENYQDFVINVKWDEFLYPQGQGVEAFVGGLRVKKITDFDSFGTRKIKNFDYINDATGKSSGNLVTNIPVYEYLMSCINPAGEQPSCNYYVRTSYSNVILGITQGSHIGYSQVSLYYDELGNNGKSIFYYSNPGTYPDSAYASSFPFAPAISFDFKRGLLIKQEDYKKSMGTYKLVKKVENEYNFANNIYDTESVPPLQAQENLFYNETLAIKAGFNSTWTNGTIPYASHITYKVISEWVKLLKTTEKNYDSDNSNYIEKITEYKYDNLAHMQLTQAETVGIQGQKLINKIKYPQDYNYTTIPSLNALVSKHIIAAPIEEQTWIEKSGTQSLLSGKITEYDPIALKPSSIYLLETDTPLSNLNNESQSNGRYNHLLSDTQKYKKRASFSYNSQANLKEQKLENDVPVSYIWGYNNQYPIAQVVNAASNQIFYTGFEEMTGSTQAKTGKRAWAGVYTVALPSPGTYTLTYWEKAGTSAWILKSQTISADTAIGASGSLIDEVRLHPAEAMMTTYTYEPLIGMTSQTDPNNQSIYYEYDSFGRLSVIKDFEGNILKTYEYQYKTKD